MKKLLSLCLTLFIPTAAFALPVGNPWDASLLCDGIFWEGDCTDYEACNPCVNWCDSWSIRAGFYGDYVYDRHMRVDSGGNHSTIHKTEIYTNAAYLAFNAMDRVDLFGTLGTTNISLSGPVREFRSGAGDNDYFYLETGTYFSWSVGVRGTIWECGCFGIGAEAQYFSTRPHINFVRDDNDAPQYGRSGGERLIYHEWQVGLGASYQYYIASCATSLVPYIGVKWSGACMDGGDLLYEDGSESFNVLNLENDRCWGYAVGVTLVGCKKVSVTVEGRFVDERAIHVNTQYRF